MTAEVLTKSRFAELVKRDAAFVTRAIASGKLSGAALVGEGRSTRIRVSVALQQLGRQLDLSQQLAQEKPILPDAPASEALADPEPPAEAGSRVHAMREEHLDLKNRRLLLELEKAERASRVAAGELVLAGDVTAALRRQLTVLVATFDEIPAAVAKAISEQHGVAYPEALITVKQALRLQRAAWAERARAMGAPAEVAAA